MAQLHEVLAANRDAIIARWKATVESSMAPDSVTTAELTDHVPAFLDEVIDALRTGCDAATPDAHRSAATHGNQRFRLGFSLEAVVREYGALRDAHRWAPRETRDHGPSTSRSSRTSSGTRWVRRSQRSSCSRTRRPSRAYYTSSAAASSRCTI